MFRIATVLCIAILFAECYGLYNSEECIQPCPPFFEEYETPQAGEGQDLLKELMEMTEMQEFAPRCIANIANYAYMAGESLEEIDLKTYQQTLDTTSPNSAHFCFKQLKGLNFEDAKNDNLDPRWNGLKIKMDLCDKYSTMKLCNIYWPCVANAIKLACNHRGAYNCTSQSCDCFDGFTNVAIRSRSEDTFISCDIGIRALFNHSLPIIPDDFIIDGNFKAKVVKIEQYKVPSPIKFRFWSQAYLLDEFNRVIDDENGTFVDLKQRKKYLPYFTQRKEDIIHQNSTLLIGVSADYVDWNAAPDLRAESLSELQMRYNQQTPLAAQTKTTRSNAPGWIAINENGLYVVGNQYWTSNKTTQLPPKSGIGYTTNIDIAWYSSQTLLKFSSIGKTEIQFEFANKMQISAMRMTWTKLIQSNATNTDLPPFNIMIDTEFTIRSNLEEVVKYLKAKHQTNTELTPPHDSDGAIKSILESRKITVRQRKYGAMVIGQIRYPQIKQSVGAVMSDKNISHAFKMGFHKVLRINSKYINVEIDKTAKMLNIIIFEDEADFASLYARLKDEEDPFTGYVSDKAFTNVLRNEMKFVENKLSISFDSWQVISDNNLFAAWYEISVFATLSEINSKTGINVATAQQYLNGFKQSLLDGMDSLNAQKTEITYFDIQQNSGYKYEAEIKVIAESVTKTQDIQSNAISSLTEISLNKGWGMVDTHKSIAVSRVSIFATILLDENTNNANSDAYFAGFPKGDTLILILKELVIDSAQSVNVDILNSEKTSRSNVLRVTVEFYLSIEQESFADDILNNVRNAKFVKLINEKALEKNVNIFATEITIIYPSKLNSNVDTIIDSRVELLANDGSNTILNQSGNTQLTDSVLPRFMNKYWPIRLPANIFCSQFYTNLQFGTAISFGFLKQYFCIQLTNIMPGSKGMVLLKSKLIFKPTEPGAPDELSALCDYWMKVQNGETAANPSMDEKIRNAGSGMEDTCLLLLAGKQLMPDNLPDTMGNVAAMLGTQIEIMQLPDIILNDPRPNAKFPAPDLLKTLGFEDDALNESNITNMTENAYERRTVVDRVPPDAFVVVLGIVVFIALKLIQRRQKRKRRRKEVLDGVAEDMQEIENMVKASKLTAEEYKVLYAKAKEKVDKFDFSKYEKRKKRKQKWTDLEKKEKKQKKRQRLKEIAKEQQFNYNLVSDERDDFHKYFESEETGESQNENLQ